jgi:hypothetical protein
MTVDQAMSVIRILEAAFPSKTRRTEAVNLYATLLAPLDYELASKAVQTIIEESTFWPKWAEIRRAYGTHAAARRRETEQAENADLLAEPSDEERQAQIEKMKAFVASRWAKV